MRSWGTCVTAWFHRDDTTIPNPDRSSAGIKPPACAGRCSVWQWLINPISQVVQIGYRFFSRFRASAEPLEALISGKVRTLPSTSSVNWPVRITEVATRT